MVRYALKVCPHCDTPFTPMAPCQKFCGDPECVRKGWLEAYLKRVYKLTLDEYQRMHDEQKGLCKICQTEGFLLKECHSLKLVVDHCHTKGNVRGLLCHNCNRALGLLKDNKEYLARAIEYLN